MNVICVNNNNTDTITLKYQNCNTAYVASYLMRLNAVYHQILVSSKASYEWTRFDISISILCGLKSSTYASVTICMCVNNLVHWNTAI